MDNNKIYNMDTLVPSEPIHPGQILKDELAERHLSQRKLAEVTGCSYTVLNEILNGKRPLSPDYALRIEAALGIKAYMLISMQSAYNLQVARNNHKLSAILNKIRASAAAL